MNHELRHHRPDDTQGAGSTRSTASISPAFGRLGNHPGDDVDALARMVGGIDPVPCEGFEALGQISLNELERLLANEIPEVVVRPSPLHHTSYQLTLIDVSSGSAARIVAWWDRRTLRACASIAHVGDRYLHRAVRDAVQRWEHDQRVLAGGPA